MRWFRKTNPVITPGVVVRLKSGGGYKMTVECIDGNLVTCVWYDCFDSFRRGHFQQQTLAIVE